MPHLLEQKLAAVRRRVRTLLLLDAAGRVVAVLVAAAIVLCLLDVLFRYEDRGLRLMSAAVLAAAGGWAVRWFLWPVLRLKLDDVELALRLESRLPILRDRLASALRFLRQREDDPLAGSTALRRSVIIEATAEIDRLNLEDAVHPGVTRRTWLISATVVAVAIILAVLNPTAARIAIARLTIPWSATQWPRHHHLTFVKPVLRLAAGQAFEVELNDAQGVRLPDDVLMQYRFQDASSPAEFSEPMRLVNDVMVARMENVVRPFSYRAVGGDDSSMEWIELQVTEPPKIEQLAVKLRFPEYTAWPPQAAESHLRALVGTNVELTGRTNKPVTAVNVHVDESAPISARLSDDRRGFVVPGSDASPFKVERTGSYWIELIDQEGFSSGDQVRYEIRAIEDLTPNVNIEQPQNNAFITPRATVVLGISAKDDLALAQVGLRFSRSDQSQSDEAQVELYQGPQHAAAPDGPAAVIEGGDSKSLTYDFDVGRLGIQPGAQITLFAMASDYFPHSGQSQPIRLTVISPDELRERLAERQTYIIGELTRLLKLQRDARAPLSEAEIQLRQVGALERQDLDRLQSADLTQRQVERGLMSPTEGVTSQIAALLGDLAQNKVDSPDVQRQMQGLLDEINRLGADELPAIGGDLTVAIKAAQLELATRQEDGNQPKEPSTRSSAVADPLMSAGQHQDEVIQTLERLTASLAEGESYRRFHTEIAALRRQQEDINRDSADLGRRTLTRELSKLTTQELADLAKLSSRQLDVARQFDHIQQRMQRAAEEGAGDPLKAGGIADALAHAREHNLSQALHEAGNQIEKNQFGQAGQGQRRAVDELQQMLDILANRREHELGRLVKKLRDAQQQLGALEREQEGLRKKWQSTADEASAAVRRRELERLTREQRQTAAAAERLARTLERLQAERAGREASQAGTEMNRAGQQAQQGDAQAAADSAAEAERDLEQAQQELAQRLAQAEADLAQEQLARMEDHLKPLLDSEQKLLEETCHYDELKQLQGELSRAQSISVGDLGKQQHSLEQEAVALAEKLASTPVFRAALEQAARRMNRAGTLLDQRHVSESTQQAEESAIDLLTHALEALKPANKEQSPDAQPDDNAGQGDEAGQQASNAVDAAQVLAELKLLKWMQDDVNERTKALDERYGDLATLPPDAQDAYQQLSEQQAVIAELTLKLAKMGASQNDDEAETMTLEDE